MDRQTFDLQLKAAAEANKFKVDHDYIVFDKTANLDYQILPHFKLRELLTKNVLKSHTELNLNLLVQLENVRAAFGHEISIRQSYTGGFHLLTFGAHDSEAYQYGEAFSLGVDEKYNADLEKAINSVIPPTSGEVGLYKWGAHIAWNKTVKRWDTRQTQTQTQILKDLFTKNSMKNLLVLGAAGAAVWFFFIRKK
ncbi:hypothetical protein [Mucilaginibacter sp.]